MSKLGERLDVNTSLNRGAEPKMAMGGQSFEGRAQPRIDSRGLDAIASIAYVDGREAGYQEGLSTGLAERKHSVTAARRDVAQRLVLAVAEEIGTAVVQLVEELDEAPRLTKAELREKYVGTVTAVVADLQQFLRDVEKGRRRCERRRPRDC